MVCPTERHKLEREKQKLGESYSCFSSLKQCVQPENVKDLVIGWRNNPWVGEAKTPCSTIACAILCKPRKRGLSKILKDIQPTTNAGMWAMMKKDFNDLSY